MKEICVGDTIRYKGKHRKTLSYMCCCDHEGYFIKLPKSEGGWRPRDTDGTISDHVAAELQDEYIAFVKADEIEEFEEKMRRPQWTVVIDRDSKKVAIVKTTEVQTATQVLKDKHSFSNSNIFQQDELRYNGAAIIGGEGSCVEFLADHIRSYDEELANSISLPKGAKFKDLVERDDVLVLNETGLDIKEETIKECRVNEKGVKATMVESGKTMAQAALHGVKLASVGKAQEAAYNKLVSLAVEHFGIKEETVRDEKIRALIMGLLPLALHPVANIYEDRIPHADKVKAICELSMTETVRRHSDQIIGFALEMFQIMAEASAPTVVATAPAETEQKRVRIKTDFTEFRVVDLKAEAKKRKVRLPRKAKRAQIIKLLEQREAEAEQEMLEAEDSELQLATA